MCVAVDVFLKRSTFFVFFIVYVSLKVNSQLVTNVSAKYELLKLVYPCFHGLRSAGFFLFLYVTMKLEV